MFPKSTPVKTVAMPPDWPAATGQKDSTVLYVTDPCDQQVSVDRVRRRRTGRAVLYACAAVLVTLTVAAVTLAAVSLVLVQVHALTYHREPIISERFTGNQPKLPDSNPPIKIDDGGLWPPDPMTPDLVTPDLVVADGGVDDDLRFDDYEWPGSSVEGPGSNDAFVGDENEVMTTAPINGQPTDWESLWSSSSSDGLSWHDYGLEKTYVSSSFPYDGYNMRGAVGVPPWEESQASTPDGAVVTGTTTSSGDGEPCLDDEDCDDAEEASGSGGWQESSDTSAMIESSYSSESYPDNTFSDMYYDSGYKKK